MAKKFLVPIDLESYLDLNKNELRNAVIQSLGTAPLSPANGQVYYDTNDNKLYLRSNGGWVYVNRNAATTSIDGLMSSSDKTKLDAVEASADVTDSINVNAAGAVMESDFNTGTFLYAAADNTPATKNATEVRSLLNVEDGATADQTASEILTLLLTVDGSGSGIDADNFDGQDSSYYTGRANHTGSQTASTISDFDTQVRTNRLDQMTPPTASLSMNSQRVTSVGAPTSDTDAATKAYVDSTKEGLSVKEPVRVATTASIAIATDLQNGDVIDGVTLATGDRVLLKDQTTGSENGIYDVVASGSGTRSDDFNSSVETVPGSFVWVNEGSANGDVQYVLTTNGPITLNTTSLTWTIFTSASTLSAGNGLAKSGNEFSVDLDANPGLALSASGLKVDATIAGTGLTFSSGVINRDTIDLTADITGTLPLANGGTNATSASGAKTSLGFMTRYTSTITADSTTSSFALTHSLGTRAVTVAVYTAASPYAEVEVDIERTSTSAVTIAFGTAPTTGTDYEVVIIG